MPKLGKPRNRGQPHLPSLRPGEVWTVPSFLSPEGCSARSQGGGASASHQKCQLPSQAPGVAAEPPASPAGASAGLSPGVSLLSALKGRCNQLRPLSRTPTSSQSYPVCFYHLLLGNSLATGEWGSLQNLSVLAHLESLPSTERCGQSQVP